MTLYYKVAYKPFYEKWRSQKKNPSVMSSLIDFANEEFPGLLSTLNEKAKFEFIELLKLLVFSHRHNKNDDYLKDPLIDFSTVREPMYKYSRHAQDKFFDYCSYAFLFAWYQANPKAGKFSAEKFAENKNPQYPERMTAEIAQLGREALLKLSSATMLDRKASNKAFLSQPAAQAMKRTLEKYVQTYMKKWQTVANDNE